MGIFGNDKKNKEEKKAEVAKTEDASSPSVSVTGIVAANVLRRPHISEKALLMGANDVYVFEVYPGVTTQDVKRAVETAYKVDVVKVNIAKTPGKAASRRIKGKRGTKSGVKKAYVTLKKGSKIQLI